MLSSEQSAGTLLASAARTADAYSEKMHNNGRYKGIIIFFNVTADPGAAAVTPKIEMLDPATGEWEAYMSATAIDTVDTDTQWIIYPLYKLDNTEIALTDESPVPLPLIWRLFMDATDTDSLTYSVGYQYLP